MKTETGLFPSAKKALGQNFLVHEASLQKIAGLVCRDTRGTVVELGAGTGNLTMFLARVCARVIAFEIDERFILWHQKHQILPENVELRSGDILRISYQALSAETGEKLHLAGNLPYNISTQVVFHVCRQRPFISRAFFLFQREVAERITSSPGTKSYGILGVISQYCADVKKVMDLPPAMFTPRPKVYSALVRFDFQQKIEPCAVNYDFFVKTVKASFSQRRKKIINCLSSYFGRKKPEMELALRTSGISPDIRAEDLEVKEFVVLSNCLYKALGQSGSPSSVLP